MHPTPNNDSTNSRTFAIKAAVLLCLSAALAAVMWYFLALRGFGLGARIGMCALVAIACARNIYEIWREPKLSEAVRIFRDRNDREQRAQSAIFNGWSLGFVGILVIAFAASGELPMIAIWFGIAVCALGLLLTRYGKHLRRQFDREYEQEQAIESGE